MRENTPAFPFPYDDKGNFGSGPQTGMTLRDWFAGQAPAVPDHFQPPPPKCADWSDDEQARLAWNDWHLRRAVAWSTNYADAMLAGALDRQEARLAEGRGA